jgi:uncharacterized coiled-coil DUF342 family protein
VIGPFVFSFGDWNNVIQYISGYGMAYALWDYFTNHKQEIKALREQINHLHAKHDVIHNMLKEKL